MKALKEEADKWKYQVEAGKNFTAQLVEKVKVLEKYEEEVKDRTSKSKDCEKLETKMETLKGILFPVYCVYCHHSEPKSFNSSSSSYIVLPISFLSLLFIAGETRFTGVSTSAHSHEPGRRWVVN